MLLGLAAHSCLTLYSLKDWSPPGSLVHGDSSGKHTGVGCHAMLQGIFPTQGSNPGLPHCSRFFTIWDTREAQEYCTGVGSLIPSPGDLPDPGIKQGSPAFQTGSLPIELPEKPKLNYTQHVNVRERKCTLHTHTHGKLHSWVYIQ